MRAAAHPAVAGVLGLAPWLPDQLDLAPLRGRRLDVLHGALDRWLPGDPRRQPVELPTRLRTGARGSASTARTRSFPARCTGSPCAARGGPRDAAPRRALGRARGGRGRTLSRRGVRRRLRAKARAYERGGARPRRGGGIRASVSLHPDALRDRPFTAVGRTRASRSGREGGRTGCGDDRAHEPGPYCPFRTGLQY